MDENTNEDEKVLEKLDWKAQEVLWAIHENGGTASTTEIKHRSRISNNDHITHRYKRASNALEPLGLIEVLESEGDTNQRNPPLVATLTSRGEELAQRLEDRHESATDLGEQYEMVEGALNQVEARTETLESRLDELAETAQQNENRITRLLDIVETSPDN